MRVLKENRLVQFSLVALVIMVTLEVTIAATSGAMLNSMMADHMMMIPSPSDQAKIREDIDFFRWFNLGILAASFTALYGGLVFIVWRKSGTFTKLERQLQEHLDESAVVDEIARIITSTLDIDEVYQKFALEMKKLVDFDRVAINTIDRVDQTFTVRYVYGSIGPIRSLGTPIPLENTQVGEVVKTASASKRSDIASEQRFGLDSQWVAMGLESGIMVPLISKGEVVGTFGLRSRQLGAYGPKEQVILERLAKQIAPAVENASLFEQVQNGIKEKAITDNVARIFTSTLKIDEVYERFAQEMKQLVDFDRVVVNSIDQVAGTRTLKYVYGEPRSTHEIGAVSPLEGTQNQQVLMTRRTLIRSDFASHREFPSDAESAQMGLRSSIMVPLISQGEVVGALGLRSRSVNAYGEREQAILERLAKQIAPALENSALYEQIVQDRQEKAAAVENLRQAYAYLDSIMLNLPAGVAILDGPEFIFSKINHTLADINGLPIEDHLGRPLSEVLPKASLDILPRMREVLDTGKPALSHEFGIPMPGDPDKMRWLLDYFFPIDGPDGTPNAVGAVVIDITEHKRLEIEYKEAQDRLNQSQKLESVGQLAGGIAHDFNNLLSVITGYTSMLLSETLGPKNADMLLEIAKAADRGTQLTSELLGFSRRQVIKPIALDVNAAVMNSYGMLRRVIGENIELVMSPDEGMPAVFMDPNQLDQIIMNLVVNARDAMPEGGTLIVAASYYQGKLSAGRDCVVLSVSDSGTGMSEEVKSHLFEPFFTTKETGKGTGLGLATCYGIVEQNGGHIEVDSELGRGSTFTVYLPATEEREESELDDVGTPEISSATTGTETILLVEDEPAVRAMEATILADQGYLVLEAGDGEEALRVCQENQDKNIQLLVTDMVMPRMSGGELISEMSVSRPDTKFLVVSGYAEDALERSVVARSDVHFMQKPFKPMELANTVREILDGVPESVV